VVSQHKELEGGSVVSTEEKRAEVRNDREEQRGSEKERRSCLFEQFRAPRGYLGYGLVVPETSPRR
jgi:hypothetical protein